MTVGLPRLVTLASKSITVFICCVSLLSSIAEMHKLGLLQDEPTVLKRPCDESTDDETTGNHAVHA